MAFRLKTSKRQLTIIITVAVLILIGVAVWVFADPVEYFLRSRDRRVESLAEDFLAAAESYYKNIFSYPWDSSLSSTSPSEAEVQTAWLQKLVDAEVVNVGFAERSYWSQIFVSRREGVLYACFSPLSKAYKGTANVQGLKRDGSTGCTENCFSCVFKNE
jgi:hypothetical protein